MSSADNEFTLLRQVARHDLVHILEAAAGLKDLVIEGGLMKPLDRVAGLQLLKEHGVGKIFQFASDRPQQIAWGDGAIRRVYMVRPTLANVKTICEQLLLERHQPTDFGPKRQFTVVFVPRKLHACVTMLEEQGLFGEIDVEEFNFSFLTLENDLLSLELPEFYLGYYLDGTNHYLNSVAKALWHLQSLYGPIPAIYGLGTGAKAVLKMMDTFFWEYGEPKANADQNISHLFVLDRSLDMVTVFLTCLTYEGMLDEQFGIVCNKVHFGSDVVKQMKSSESEKPSADATEVQGRTETLTCDDAVYSSVRDKHITAVFPFLSAKAKHLQEGFSKGHQLDKSKIDEMKKFVSQELGQLKRQHKSLELHIAVSEVILQRSAHGFGMQRRMDLEHSIVEGGASMKEMLAQIEDIMCQQTWGYSDLAAMCLLSLTQGGISPKEYHWLRTQTPRVFAKESRLKDLLLAHCAVVTDRFVPAWWCIWGNWQTALRQLLRDCPSLPFEREILRYKDGGQSALDWLHPANDHHTEAPLVLILPGLTGSTHDAPYVLHICLEAQKFGYRIAVLNARGLGGVPFTTSKAYCASCTDDMEEAMPHIRKRYPKSKLMVLGFSLGGMITFNYLSKMKTKEACHGLLAAMVVSVPWNPKEATETFEEFWPKLLFNRRLAHNLKMLAWNNRELFEEKCNMEAVMSSETVRDFDTHFIVPVFGYRDWPDYYHDAALHYKVHDIPIPTVCLNAIDDCFSPIRSIPFSDVENSSNVAIVLTKHGGHTAFQSRLSPHAPGFIEDLFIQYSQMVFNHL